MRTQKLTNIIRGALARNDMTAKDLAKQTGIPYATLMQMRFPDPMSWKFCEIRAVFRAVDFFPDEKKAIGKEVGIIID